MDISSSNYFSVSASTNKGMSGMISGMDTESMVKQMLSGTQSKIDKQMGLKQQAEWKQDIYRDVITSINDFQAKYLDTSYGSTLKTNFASTTFFNSMLSSVTSGDGVRIVSTGTDAAEGETKVGVTSLATAAKLESTQTMSTGKIVGSALTEAALREKLDKRVSFTIDNNGTTDTVEVNLNNIRTESDMLSKINGAFQGKGVTAEIFDGHLRLISGADVKVNVSAGGTTKLGLEMTGLKTYSTSPVSTGRMLQGGFVHAEAGPSFTVSLDGVEKQITLNAVADGSGNVNIDSVVKGLGDELKKAFGDYVKAAKNGDSIVLSTTFADKGHELVVTGIDAKTLGITPGATSALDTGTKLKDLRDSLGLVGDLFAFTINGEQFSFTGNNSIGSVMNTINSSNAGVRLTYSTLDDIFQIESTSTGKQHAINIQQTQGNLLSKLFGTTMSGGTRVNQIPSATTAASRELTVDTVVGGDLGGYTAESGATFKLNVDGVNHTFTLPKDGNGDKKSYNAQEIVDVLNAQLAATFGTKGADGNVVVGQEHIQVAMDADGKMSVKVDNGSVVKFAKTSVDIYNDKALTEAKKTDLGLAMGFAVDGASNVATKDNLANAVQFKGLTISTQELATITAAFKDGRLVLSGTVPPLQAVMEELFGAGSLNGDRLILGGGAAAKIDNGADAVLTINGVATTRSSNTFTVDGITMEAVKAGGEAAIGTKRDTETIVEGFQSFVDDYNALVKKLTDLVDEKQSWRSYAPLTSEQKKEMSEREIELWEEKAKEGLLHRDSAIDSFLSQMRLAMYTKPAGSRLALYNIGIETTKWEDKGQLQLDETALRNALATDPNSVMTLFTDRENGLGAMLHSIILSAANPSSASPGSLVQIAGMEGWGSETNNDLSDSISSIASRIKDLQAKYESERARYWNQFNSMEKALANFNSQSNMIAQQFSGGY